MRLRRALLVAVLVAGAAIACSLNPQPLPPGQPDSGVQAGLDAGSDATKFGDAGNVPPDAASDGAPPVPQTDGGETDAGDAETDAADASEDAGDAGDDGAVDAPND